MLVRIKITWLKQGHQELKIDEKTILERSGKNPRQLIFMEKSVNVIFNFRVRAEWFRRQDGEKINIIG